MSYAVVPFGTESAQVVPPASRESQLVPVSAPSVVKTIGDLLIILRDQPPPTFGTLKTTCNHFGTYLGQPSDQLSFTEVAANRAGFRHFLESRQYAENSIRAYVYHVQILLRLAQKHGWDPDHAISREWKDLISVAAKAGVLGVTKHFSHITKTPKEITIVALDTWEDSKIRSGILYASARQTRNRFLRFLKTSGWSDLKFPGTKALGNYGIPLEQLPAALGEEIRKLLIWKQAEFAINRPKKGKIRAVSAAKLSETICRLAGYAINIRGLYPTSVRELIEESTVLGFVEWTINERGVKGLPFQQSLGMLFAVVRYHPSFKDLDFKWFKALIESINTEASSERRKRKEQKYVDYPLLEAIPGMIRSDRKVLERKSGDPKQIACLAMEELVMLWLTILPWRQRNVRQCRIGGTEPNLFKGRIPSSGSLDKPIWVIEEEKKNPNAEFWQVRFSAKETKTDISIDLLLPRQLIGLLEEYLTEHRPKLLRGRQVDTLFVNSVGNSLNSKLMQRIVGQWTIRYAGIRTTPHLFRDAVAFQWLKEHPSDYLTLSKMLWHKSIETTITIYGSRFNESSGVTAMEAWLDQRQA